MKTFLIFTILMIFVGCNKNEVSLAQPQNFSESLIITQKLSPGKNPKWTAGTYKGLQLGKSTVEDVKRIFGNKPKYILNPEDEYDNPIESKLDYVYENEPQIIIDKKSKIVIEIWGGDFSTFKEAIDKYGDEFYEVEFTKKGCVFNEYKEKQNQEYPLNIAYPQFGFYFFLNAEKNVISIYYLAKCE